MERHVLDLISYASTLGVNMRIVTRTLDWRGERPLGVEFVVVPDRTPFARLNTLFFETGALKKCKVNWPTIAISRSPGATMAIVGGTHQGHLNDRGKTQSSWFDRSTIVREKAMYHEAQSIVAHSGKVAQETAQFYGVPTQKITTLYPPVDELTFTLAARNDRNSIRQALGISEEEFLLLFPSNNHELKGADLILEALQDFDPRIRFAAAGKAPLRSENVINLGFRHDMPSLYAAADAVILASRYEAFGLVGPEAVLCGTPVLFANTVGAAEVLSETACIQFERTVPSLRGALSKALQRFDAGTLNLEEPSAHIHYPYSLSQHFDAVFALLATSSINE